MNSNEMYSVIQKEPNKIQNSTIATTEERYELEPENRVHLEKGSACGTCIETLYCCNLCVSLMNNCCFCCRMTQQCCE